MKRLRYGTIRNFRSSAPRWTHRIHRQNERIYLGNTPEKRERNILKSLKEGFNIVEADPYTLQLDIDNELFGFVFQRLSSKPGRYCSCRSMQPNERVYEFSVSIIMKKCKQLPSHREVRTRVLELVLLLQHGALIIDPRPRRRRKARPQAGVTGK